MEIYFIIFGRILSSGQVRGWYACAAHLGSLGVHDDASMSRALRVSFVCVFDAQAAAHCRQTVCVDLTRDAAGICPEGGCFPCVSSTFGPPHTVAKQSAST